MFNTNKQKILIHFIETEPKSWYSLEISRALKISDGSANVLLKELEKEGYLSSENFGRTIVYTLKSESPKVGQYKVLLNVEKASDELATLKGLVEKAILFGSRASGENVAESDYDILIVTDNREKMQEIVSKTKNDKYKSIILTPVEYISLKAKNKVLYDEIGKGVTVLNK